MPTGLHGICTIVHSGKAFEGSYSVVRDRMRVICELGSKTSVIAKSPEVHIQAKAILTEIVATHVK